MRVGLLAIVLAVVACGEDLGHVEPPEGEFDGGTTSRDGGDAPGSDASSDTTPPGAARNLRITPTSHTTVEVTWDAPGGDGDVGRAAKYDVRWSASPIEDATAFGAATVVPDPPVPRSSGTPERIVIDRLPAGAAVHVAVRATDEAGNVGPIAFANAATKARASFLVSEVAPVNSDAEGGDFVELVATKAGWAGGIEVRHTSGSPSTLLHAIGPLEVAEGDRIVVHARGLPGPPGFVQEDTSRDRKSSSEPFASPDAFDIYAGASGLVATNGLVTVVDAGKIVDAVAYSNRARDASSTAMTAFANAHAAGAWTFAAAPVDGDDDCATLGDVVNANGSATTSPACGGYPGFLAAGSSIQRNGVVDTNTRADFHVAPQTRGAENAPFCDPEGARLVLTEVSPAPVNLLELTATHAGALRGFSVRRNPTAAAPAGSEVLAGGSTSPFPSICVAEGDVVLVHLAMPGGTPSESTSKDELPAATNPGWHDGAWDVATTTASSNLSYGTSTVIGVRDPAGRYIEAAVFTSATTAASATFVSSLQFVQGLGLWMPADCNGQPCDGTTTPTARELAAVWAGVGSTAAEASCRRTPGGGPIAASWSVGPSSFGVANP